MPRPLVTVVVTMALGLAACAASATAAVPPFVPGAPGIGDPYYPLDGNGGYDVVHYGLDLGYEPETDTLSGVATIRARATQDLSSFNLDLVDLTVRSITVGGRPATWTRDGQELTIAPRRGLRRGRRFTTVIRYDGVPETIEDAFGLSGFFHTDDGAIIVGQPHVAATWFPANDHPLDKAAFTFRITVPRGLEAVSNGVLKRRRAHRGRTTWTWDAREPMAPYLAMAAIGEFGLRAYRDGGIRYWDAIDPDLFAPVAPRTGAGYALSQVADASYKRLSRAIAVPAGGGVLSFWINRETEPGADLVFVEARPAGAAGWTRLPDLNGHTGADTSAATGSSGGYEQWSVDLAAYAGEQVELAISYVSDGATNHGGVFVDDITVPGGAGSTSFEADGDTLDGWTVPGAPGGSGPNANDWIAGTVADAPRSVGEVAAAALDRQPAIIAFLSRFFGRYPFSAAGGIVDDVDALEFALENQTRPIYPESSFLDRTGPTDSVVVHELAHQWIGDSLALGGWQHIWLNEGFATFMEWLWSEEQGRGTVQELADAVASRPADDPFWSLTIGDPGPEGLFDGPIYDRGALTLHALRLEVGDARFFAILRLWTTSQAGGTVTTPEFIALAERVTGRDLGAFFDEWLFASGRPASLGAAARRGKAAPPAGRPASRGVRR